MLVFIGKYSNIFYSKKIEKWLDNIKVLLSNLHVSVTFCFHQKLVSLHYLV